MLDPIQYELRFFQNNLADPEPEPEAGAETSIFRLWLQPKGFGSMRLRLHNTWKIAKVVIIMGHDIITYIWDTIFRG
jgi:hypothetical protein